MLLPYKHYVHTITIDNGPELAEHEAIARALNTTVYFAHPYCSWEKGLVEYTNKLLRQYLPKKESFDNFTDKQIADFQHKLNKRPRKS